MPSLNPHKMLRPLEMVGHALKDQSHAPAYVIEIVSDGRSAVYADGVAQLGTKQTVSTGNTFEIGSQTKMMTAALTLQLADAGRIDLDARIADYLPASILHDIPNAGRATVRELLAMTSGIPSYTEAKGQSGQPLFIEKLLAGETFGPTEALEVARGMKPTGAPGDHYHYSNTNYLLLGALLEAQTGKSLETLIESRIFKPLGMDHSTARPFGSDDPRLNSYATLDGRQIDVTHVPWHFKGEAGVVSTTGDMIHFLEALVKPGALLSAQALAEMTDFHITERGQGYTLSFGLGLAKIDFDNGESFVGFTGGTLGTSSSTYVSVKTGAVVSIAGTSDNFASDDGAFALLQMIEATPAWDTSHDNGAGPLTIRNGSAADAALLSDRGALLLDVDGARTTVKHDLGDLRPDHFHFADDSILLVGDGRRGGPDQRSNDIDIAHDHPDADGKANHVMGLGGNDRITGGSGSEWLEGNRGNDRLSGGKGDDLIDGGAGRDMLRGGSGSDHFIFRTARAADGDVIRDFQPGIDRIDLTAIDAVPGHRDSAFHWLGEEGFEGRRGALHAERTETGLVVSGDVDGDGKADFHIAVDHIDHLTRSDFLL